MPVPKGYTLDQPTTPKLPSGYTLDTPSTTPADTSATTTQPPAPGFLEPHEEAGTGIVGRLKEAVRGAAGSLGIPLQHPLETAKGVFTQFQDVMPAYQMTRYGPIPVPNRAAVEHAQEAVQQAKEHPAYTAGAFIGPLVAGEVLKTVPGVGETPGTLRRRVQALAGVGKKPVVEAITKTATKSAEEAEGASATNRVLEDQRIRRTQLQAQVTQDTQALKLKTEAIKTKAGAQNAANWTTVRSKVGEQPVNLQGVTEVIKNQEAKMDPNSQAIFRQIVSEATPQDEINRIREEVMAQTGITGERRAEMLAGKDPELQQKIEEVVESQAAVRGIDPDATGEVPFTRLQGWYTELGQKQFTGGYLPGNVYSAVDAVRNAVRNTMDETAKAHGAFDDLERARESNVKYQEAFGRQLHRPLSAAQEQLKKTNPEAFAHDQAIERIRKIAQHDPTYAKDVEQLDRNHETLQSFPSEQAMRNLLQQPPNLAEVDIQKVRQDLLKQESARWSNISQYKIRRLATGVMGGLAGLAAGGGHGAIAGFAAAEMAPNVVSAIINRPAVLEWLTKPTLEDVQTISQIPNADRIKIVGSLTQMAVQEGRAGRLVRLAPAVVRLLGPANVAMITAASPAAQLRTAEEAKKRVATIRGTLAGGVSSP